MNNVMLGGRMSSDPIRKKGDVTFINVAVSKKEGAEFIDCVCFGKLAENVEKYTKKGDPVIVTGHVVKGDKDRDYKIEIIADRVEFMGSKRSD